jgi:hypothetical protein
VLKYNRNIKEIVWSRQDIVYINNYALRGLAHEKTDFSVYFGYYCHIDDTYSDSRCSSSKARKSWDRSYKDATKAN